MQQRKIAVLTVSEAKEALFDFYADTIVNDRPHIRELIANGDPINGAGSKFIPDVTKWQDKEIADQFGELNLGEKFAAETGVDVVVVECANPDIYVPVWDIENVEPTKRQQVYSERKTC